MSMLEQLWKQLLYPTYTMFFFFFHLISSSETRVDIVSVSNVLCDVTVSTMFVTLNVTLTFTFKNCEELRNIKTDFTCG